MLHRVTLLYTFACDAQGIDVDGMKQQLSAALGRIKAGSGSLSSITSVERDLEYAEQLLRSCVTQPTGVQATLQKARAALYTQKILLV